MGTTRSSRPGTASWPAPRPRGGSPRRLPANSSGFSDPCRPEPQAVPPVLTGRCVVEDSTHPDMVGPVKRALAAVCVFPRGDLSVRAIGIFDFRLSRRLEALVFSLPIGHALCPLSRPFLSFLLARSVWLLLPLVGRTGCGKIVTTVDQSDIRVLGPHDLIRQGLPHSTCGRAAHPSWPCPRVRRGSPLTVHMPQPVRTTSEILTPYVFSRLHDKNHCSSITSSRAITQMNPTSSRATATCFMGWHRADGFSSRA